MLKTTHEIKKLQIKEASTAVEALNKTRKVTEERYRFYDSIENRIASEKEYVDQLQEAQTFQELANLTEVGVAGAAQIPTATAGTCGMGSTLTASFGGLNVVAALQSTNRILSWKAGYHSYKANMASIKGSWERRAEEWKLQKRLAARELEQIDKQTTAAEIRMAITEKELESHEKQIENSAAVEDFLRSKYTNEELYSWITSQVSTVFFQCYKLAFDLAKRAEKAYRFERGVTSSTFIQFGYWDSLRKGLLSGERLHLDVKRMEMAYMDRDRRVYEITKHISLVLHDPIALITLKETGRCELEFSEALFDMDYPGHYMRRIKAVSVTIPCVTGPYTSVNCTLTLLSSKIRVDGNARRPYLEEEEDTRFVPNYGAMTSIATSQAQNDSGMFELNFRDERYLPFEGAGVVSRWRIDMPRECNAFDYNTLSDVLQAELHSPGRR